MNWISGPAPLTERRLDVMVGTFVVLLVNGKPHLTVFTAGRNGGFAGLFEEDRHIPMLGSKSTLTFGSVRLILDDTVSDVLLADQSRVDVTATLEVEPAWRGKPSSLISWVEQYGANPATIEQAAQARIRQDFQTGVRQALGRLTHEQVHANTAPDRLLGSEIRSTGLLQVTSVLRASISRDEQVEQVRRGERNVIVDIQEARNRRLVAGERHAADLLDATLAGELEEVSFARGLDQAHREAIGVATTQEWVARQLGMPMAQIADPKTFRLMVEQRGRTIHSLLTESMDLLPLFQELDLGHPSDFLSRMYDLSGTQQPGARAVVGPVSQGPGVGGDPPSAPPGRRRWRSTVDVRRRMEKIGMTDEVIGASAFASPHGDRVIVITRGGEDRTVGDITQPGQGSDLIVIADHGDKTDALGRLLHAAAAWCVSSLAARPVVTLDGDRRVEAIEYRIDDIEMLGPSEIANVEVAFATWVIAISGLIDDTEPRAAIVFEGVTA